MSAPRNILLMDEFENAMKGKYGPVSFGIVNGDITLSNWQGSIVTEKGDIFEFTFVCNNNFPANPPDITFDKNIVTNKYVSKICSSDGKLKDDIVRKLNWSKFTSIGEYLIEIKKFLDK